jgi:hypothetical protein
MDDGRIPVRVPEGAKQTGETPDRWSWVEPSVWTERMRTALDNGVKGGKWFSLVDKVPGAQGKGTRLGPPPLA